MDQEKLYKISGELFKEIGNKIQDEHGRTNMGDFQQVIFNLQIHYNNFFVDQISKAHARKIEIVKNMPV